MAGCKIVTRKYVPFYGRNEEFTNVYYFGDGGAGLSPTEGVATTLINNVIASEKGICSSDVKFLGGVAYHIGVADTPGDTDAIAIVELVPTTNPGTAGASDTMYRECAIDFKFLLGGKRYLRTMLHTCVLHGYNASGSTSTAVASLSTAMKDFATKMLNGPWNDGYQRIAPNGDRPQAIQYNPFLEHRQFHRYRNRNAGLLG